MDLRLLLCPEVIVFILKLCWQMKLYTVYYLDCCRVCVCSPSMQNALPSMALSPEEETEVEVTVQEKEKMINISYELAAEASKRSKLVAGTPPERRGIQGHVM